MKYHKVVQYLTQVSSWISQGTYLIHEEDTFIFQIKNALSSLQVECYEIMIIVVGNEFLYAFVDVQYTARDNVLFLNYLTVFNKVQIG